MKFTLLTFLISMVSLAFSLVIPLGAKLSTNTVAVREPTFDTAYSSPELSFDSVSIRDKTAEGSAVLDPNELTVTARGNDCGSNPFQNPGCSAGSSLKIGSGKIILGALVVMVAGVI